MVTELREEKLWEYLSAIPDPDIPVISITDLGLVRNIKVAGEKVIVTITPSYSGCPAMKFFKDEIISVLKIRGFENVEIETVFFPAWSSDWISDTAKTKMKTYGIAPPENVSADLNSLFCAGRKKITCPSCNGKDTKLTSQFGSTPCKSLWFCNSCQQPFEHFKCL